MSTPALPPCIIIHGLDHARAALTAAQGRDIILRSPSGAAALHGVEWWKRLLDRLRRDFPDAPFTAILDCGDCPGWAMAALRAEAGLIVLAGDGPAHRAVREAAEQKEAWGRVGGDTTASICSAPMIPACPAGSSFNGRGRSNLFDRREDAQTRWQQYGRIVAIYGQCCFYRPVQA